MLRSPKLCVTVVTKPATYTLSDSGWPRPSTGRYPIPWVSPVENLGEVNEGRRLSSIGGGVCQVCGEGYAYGDFAYGFTTLTEDGERREFQEVQIEVGQYLTEVLPPATVILFLDGALMHHRCAKLTAAMCPHVRDRKDLICVRVPANDATPRVDPDGEFRPTYPAGDVMCVPWPTPRRP